MTQAHFTQLYNKVQKIKSASLHDAYLDGVLAGLKTPPVIVSSNVASPFSPFDDLNGYGGVSIYSQTMSSGTRQFMAEHEDYIQSSHQLWVDEAYSTDNSHKCNKTICVNVGGACRKPFGAVYSVMSSSGLPNISRWRFTNCADELEQIIVDWARVRKNTGQPKLYGVTRDNAAAETNLMQSVFPELTRDVQPFIEKSQGRVMNLTEDQAVLLDTFEKLREIMAVVIDELPKTRKRCGGTVRIGFDAEFEPNNMLVFSFKVEGDELPAYVVHCQNWRSAPHEMKQLFELYWVVIVGVNVSGDCRLLRHQFGAWIRLTKRPTTINSSKSH